MEQIEYLSAVLITSPKPERLAAFYRDILGIPLAEERHGNAPLHYGCFAIPSDRSDRTRSGARGRSETCPHGP
ncbi:MAG TPA: hypothetical protein VF942_13135, partial [Acidimicrobiales bacterium]